MELTFVDYLVFFVFVGGVALFGCSFFKSTKGSTSAFTRANGAIPTWVVGMSIFATFVSSISFLGLPGGSYAGNWNQLIFSFTIPSSSARNKARRRCEGACEIGSRKSKYCW